MTHNITHVIIFLLIAPQQCCMQRSNIIKNFSFYLKTHRIGCKIDLVFNIICGVEIANWRRWSIKWTKRFNRINYEQVCESLSVLMN